MKRAKHSKILAIVLAITMVLTMVPTMVFAKTADALSTVYEEPVKVTDPSGDTKLEVGAKLSELFPDENFRSWIKGNVLKNSNTKNPDYTTDAEGNELLTETGITKIQTRTAVVVSNKSIGSLKGIEHFSAITTLSCANNQLSELNVSELTNLTTLNCSNNKNIAELDVSKLTNLTRLICDRNQITELDVSKLTKLTELNCYNNQIEELDVSGLINLTLLDCIGNKLKELDVSKLTALTTLNCNRNQIAVLDVSELTNLTTLNCNDNQITELDVSNLTKLTELSCYNNQIEELDVSELTNLTTLNCSNNKNIAELDVSKLTNLTRLICDRNQITKLDVSKLTKLTELNCYNNQIEELDVSDLINLTLLDCIGNKLKELDVSKLTALTTLNCNRNQIAVLDVSELTNLTTLNCNTNQITELDVSKLTNLTTLNCNENQITELDVSNLTKLAELGCYNNQIEELDVSALSSLTTLLCSTNQITELDLSKLTDLTRLSCSDNQIGSLNLDNNTNLTSINISMNPLEEITWPNNDQWDKSGVTILQYTNTNIDNVDLNGFTGLTSFSGTHGVNFSATDVKDIIITGDRAWNDPYCVYIKNADSITMPDDRHYFVIVGGEDTTYGYRIPAEDGRWVSATDKPLSGGILNNQGILVIDATENDIVNSDDGQYKAGDIRLTPEHTLITPSGKITFGEGAEVALRDGKVIVFRGPVSLTELNPQFDENGKVITITEDNTVTILPNGEMVIDTINNTGKIPAGSQIIDNKDDSPTKGDVTITTDAADLDTTDSTYTTGKPVITVPADKADQITVDENGTITVPSGSTVHNPDGTTETMNQGGAISKDGQITIKTVCDVNGHSYDDSWKSDETNHWKECIACGDKAETAAHDFEWIIDKEATETEKGSKHEECSVCGYKKEAIEIPAAGKPGDNTTGGDNENPSKPSEPDTDVPQTGDNSNLWIWLVLLAVSATGIGITLVTSNKKRGAHAKTR